MKINVAKFVQLTAAIAAVGCDRPPAPAAPQTVTASADPEPPGVPSTSDPPPEVASGPVDDRVTPPEPAPPPPMAETVPMGPPVPALPPELSESAANLAACNKLSPMCEGLPEECRVLSQAPDPSGEQWGMGFRPRVAEQIAACWSTSLRPPKCRTPAMNKCVKTAVMKAKVDKRLDAACNEVLAQCKTAGLKPKYSKDQCLHAVSAVAGQSRIDALRAMGPMAEGCSLDFVLPYYPFGKTW